MLKLFVYGTLKRGGRLNAALEGQKFVKEITTNAEFTLYNTGWYPAMCTGGSTAIKGELWEINEALVPRLDSIEGHPELFKRSEIELEDGSKATAYVYNRGTERFTACGDEWKI